jgi:hypothetical protein
LLTLVTAVGLAACSSSSTKPSVTTSAAPNSPAPAQGALPWPAPSDPMGRATAAGLVPETSEHLDYHVHAHLDVFLNGVAQTVPAGLGINTADPGVHRGVVDGHAAFGGIRVPCGQPCISPLHTHDVTGILHTESSTAEDNTLGQLFVEWGVQLTATCVGGYCPPSWPVGVYVDGRLRRGDLRTIALSDHEEIAIVIGAPPKQIPTTADWSKA